MIKWEHSIFALPFALCGAMLAAGGLPSAHQLIWIVVAMIAARSAAMAFNRWADAAIDAANPRTRTRALPAGHLTPAFVATFVVISSAIFILAASQLNRLALELAPVALAVLLLYSYTKRATRWSHLVLGFALGMAPSAPWIAGGGSLGAGCAGSANPAAHRCSNFLGGRLRRSVCLSGLRFRPPERAAFHSAICRDSRCAMDRAGFSWSDDRLAGRSGDRVRDGEVGGLWCGGCDPAAALRTFVGSGRRFIETECRVLHHEWCHFGAVLGVCRGRSAAAKIRDSRRPAPSVSGVSGGGWCTLPWH